MKYLDKVKVIMDRDEYAKDKVFSGMIGRISSAEIRDNYFEVMFIDPKTQEPNFDFLTVDFSDDFFGEIKIEDLELVEDMHCSDEWLLEALPKNNPNWWCKVEDGYITNLKGEKKNKIPYDYNS